MRYLGVFLCLLVPLAAVAQEPYMISAQETLLSHSQLVVAGLTVWPDSPLGALANADGTFTFYAAQGSNIPHGAQIVRSVGTLDNPIAYGVSFAPVVATSCDYYAGGQVFRDNATALLLMFAHCEHWYAPNGKRFVGSVALAVSWDDGYSWSDLGDIITSYYGAEIFALADVQALPHPNIGTGGSVLLWDGTFYFVYNDRTSLVPHDSLSIARAPVQAVFAAARAGHTSPWVKYAGGCWCGPGLRGWADELEMSPSHGIGVFAVGYSAVRQRFVLIGADWGKPTPVYLMESADGLRWQDVQQLPNEQALAIYFAFPGGAALSDSFAVYFLAAPILGWADSTVARRELVPQGEALPPCAGLHCVGD